MENLRDLMQCVDDISKVIPEGTYLEMCDKIKKLHDTMPRDDDPPVLDTRRLLPRVPFQPVIPEHLDLTDGYEPAIYDEYVSNRSELRQHIEEQKTVRAELLNLRVRKNITRIVKERAVREKARIEGVFLETATFKELCSKIPLLVFVNERDFYKSYIEYENERIGYTREQYLQIDQELQEVITSLEHRQHFLRTRYNL
mgnify:CR=1 FL=1